MSDWLQDGVERSLEWIGLIIFLLFMTLSFDRQQPQPFNEKDIKKVDGSSQPSCFFVSAAAAIKNKNLER